MTAPANGQPASPASATAEPGIARAASMVSLGTLLSRFLGLARDQLFAILFGASYLADAFVIAFRIPNLLRDLLAEGALSTAFVPAFTELLRNRGREAAFALANRLMTTLLVLLGLIVAAGIWQAEAIVGLVAGGFAAHEPGKVATTVLLTRVMMPFIAAVSLAAVAMGMLNALGIFFIPSFASASFNIVALVVGVGLWFAGASPEVAILGWALGTVAGGLAQFLVQVPALVAAGWRWRPALDLRFRDEGLRRILRTMGPATIGLAATQVNVIINSIFAAHEAGAAAWLNYAFRLMQLPLGLFGVAVGTIATASLAHRAADRDLPGMRATLVESLRLVAFLTIPATFGLVALGTPVIRLIYQHGRFTAADTEATAQALFFYALGLFAYAAVKVVAPAFYALERTRAPMYASLLAVAANVTANLLLFPVLGFRGLALGTSIAATLNFLILAAAFQHRVGGLADRRLWDGILRMLAAALPMAAAAWGASWLSDRWLGVDSLAARLADTLLPVGIGVLAYAAVARLLGIAELGALVGAVRRRLGR